MKSIWPYFCCVFQVKFWRIMKRVFLIPFLICAFLCLSMAQPSAGAQTKATESSALPVFKFEKDVVDLGAIQKNLPVKVEFTFENTGKMPLVIKNVRTNCGCTEVNWPREPVMPGKSGTVTASYDASDSGVFNKKLTILANTAEGMHVLSIRGSIKE